MPEELTDKTGSVESVMTETLIPTFKLLGHVLAGSIGFAGMTFISLIPLVVIKIVVMMGFANMASTLEPYERWAFMGDMLLLGINLGAGTVLFFVETAINLFRSIKRNLKG